MLEVRKLAATDDLSSFRSGNKDLDRWVRKFGLANQHLFGVTYVAVDGSGPITGFVTVASSSIETSSIAGPSGPSSCPVLLLGRMAVSQDVQRSGIGGRLMRRVFELARDQHSSTGCQAVIVDAKPEAVPFYERYEFVAIEVAARTTRMFLEIGTVLAAIGD